MGVGLVERILFVFDDLVLKFAAIATLDDDNFAFGEVWQILEDADLSRAAVMAIDDHGPASARFTRISVPADVEDIVRGFDLARIRKADGENARFFDAEALDLQIARARP